MTSKTPAKAKSKSSSTKKKPGAKRTPARSSASAPRKRVQFAFDAPDANEVAVTGSFCDWQTLYPLKQQKNGAWKRTIELDRGRHEYRFVVDGEWREDPRSDRQVPNPYGGMNSVLETK